MSSVIIRNKLTNVCLSLIFLHGNFKNDAYSVLLFSCLQLTLWINEKMLTAQDMSYDEARNLHSKWQKHQAFMAELASNKDWLDKIDKVWPLLY